MSPNELFLRRCRRWAVEEPRRALVELYLHLADQAPMEQGLDRVRCQREAEEALLALADGRRPAAVHPAALLRALDEHLALEVSGQDPWVQQIGCPGHSPGRFWITPRPEGWRSRFSQSQPGHREFWMRRHQVVPVEHRGIALRVQGVDPRLASALNESPLPFIAGGFCDSVLPAWNEASPYRCRDLAQAEIRRLAVEDLLEVAVEAGARVVVLPELTVDGTVRSSLREWLRENHARHSIALLVAGSFHEDGPEGGRGWNVAHIFDAWGDELFCHVKLRPMRAMPGGETADEDIDSGTEARLLRAPFGLVGVAICLDFCEEGDTPVTDLWRTAGPALMLVPSMAADAANNAHRREAERLARQHGTAVVVASQHPAKAAACGLFWVAGEHQGSADQPEEGRPTLTGRWYWRRD
jgi:predicted amidohydrolase